MFPELLLYEELDEREEAFRAVMESMTRRGLLLMPFYVIIAIFVFRPIVGIVGGYFTFVADLDIWFPLPTFFLILLVPPSTIYIFRRKVRRSLRLTLNANGIPVCMSCGYCLRGLEEQRCPECGYACQGESES